MDMVQVGDKTIVCDSTKRVVVFSEGIKLKELPFPCFFNGRLI